MNRKSRNLGFALLGLFALLAFSASAADAIPEGVVNGNVQAVQHITEGAPIRAVWVEGKFGEYGDPVHVIRFDRKGNPVAVEGKFIRLGDDRFQFSAAGNNLSVSGTFGAGGGSSFGIKRNEEGKVQEIRGRFFHYGAEQFQFRWDDRGRLLSVKGKFGQEGTEQFSFGHDNLGRVSEIRGKFLIYGEERFQIGYYGDTNLVRMIQGKFAKWGDNRFTFYYESWPK